MIITMTKTFYPKGFIEIPTQVTLYERPEKNDFRKITCRN